jgi:hypothetical protein
VKLKGWGLTQIHEKFNEAQTLKLEISLEKTVDS